ARLCPRCKRRDRTAWAKAHERSRWLHGRRCAFAHATRAEYAYSSATKPDAFTTGPQRSKSAFTVAANLSGGWYVVSLPILARLSVISGDRTASPIAALSARTASGGVLAGAKAPIQVWTTTL